MAKRAGHIDKTPLRHFYIRTRQEYVPLTYGEWSRKAQMDLPIEGLMSEGLVKCASKGKRDECAIYDLTTAGKMWVKHYMEKVHV